MWNVLVPTDFQFVRSILFTTPPFINRIEKSHRVHDDDDDDDGPADDGKFYMCICVHGANTENPSDDSKSVQLSDRSDCLECSVVLVWFVVSKQLVEFVVRGMLGNSLCIRLRWLICRLPTIGFIYYGRTSRCRWNRLLRKSNEIRLGESAISQLVIF